MNNNHYLAINEFSPKIVEGPAPKTWGTFEGVDKTIDLLDHQHLSNIFWYHLIHFNFTYRFVKNEIDNRFSGQILPYKPLMRFKAEMDMLESKSMIIWNIDKTYGTIVFNPDIIIGEVGTK